MQSPEFEALDLADEGYIDLFYDDTLLALFARVVQRDPILEKYAPFSKLENIMIAGTETKYPISSDSFGTCASLPAIKSMHGFNICDSEQQKASATCKRLSKGELDTRND